MLIIMTVLISLFALFVVMFLVQYRAYNRSRCIRVIYENNTYGMIKRTLLEEFIFSGSITKFFRSSGWVTVGVDPTRKTNHGHLRERRGIVTC
jgi:hypothetical protein